MSFSDTRIIEVSDNCVSSYFEGPIVTFIVGDGDSWRFCIHRGLISSSSAIFEDVVKDFRQDFTPEIRLQDVCPSVFAIFANWLYKGQFPDVEEDESTPSILSLCLQAFVFGDAYSVLPFKQLSFDKIEKQLSNPRLSPKNSSGNSSPTGR